MDSSQVNEALQRAAAETIQSLALLFLVPEEEAPAFPASTPKSASVAFTGPFSGMLALTVSEELARELTANMLGLDDGTSATIEQQEDALKELANVVCGNLLPTIAGPEPVFHIDAPVLSAGEIGDHRTLDSRAGTARLWTESGMIELKFFADGLSVSAQVV